MSTELDNHLIEETDESAPPIQYRSVSALAILAVVVSAFSILTVFHWLFWLVFLTAILLGYLAIKRIRFAPTEYTGIGFARSGMAAALVLGLIGQGIHYYIRKYTVPYGYKPITWDLLEPDSDNPAEIIPPAAYELEPNDTDRDRRIYIKGFINLNMTDRTINLRQFILVPTASHCNFCQTQIKSTEMILVTFTGGLSIDATQNEIKLGGKFKVDPDQAANPFGGLPYQLEADFLQE
ncbi:MAG: DUF4190 domain-containing protein [Pirellulales bacterium]|nr:DUF4190 domain-containing protein [Pirellulales bacterium]